MNTKLRIGTLQSKPAANIGISATSQTLGWHIRQLNIPTLWSETKGKGVKVAVIDTAVDSTHPDLKIEGGFDFIRNAPLSNAIPQIGHGTHVCGIIGAKDNSFGTVGIAPECSLYSLVVLSEQGDGDYPTIIKALDWCIANKMDVINMSMGGGSDTPEFYAAIRRVYDAKIPIICAGGNEAWDTGYIDFPGTYDETISVAAIGPDFTRASFSSIGPNLDVAAPGVDILSTIPQNSYALYSGTSMAAPFVTGLVALIIAKHRLSGGSTPLNNVEDVRDHLIKVAKDVDYKGRDSFLGYGLINPNASLDFENQPESPVLLESKYLATKFRIKLSKDYVFTSPTSKLSNNSKVIGKVGEIIQISFPDSVISDAVRKVKMG